MSSASTSAPVPAGNGAVAASSSAASVPSASSSSSSSSKSPVQASEVGWLFVPQYYTFLNQNPGRLHCFYTKKSTLLHGTEQENANLCFGQQQIHDKITSLGFEDAKVFVSNVDSQSSASGGIIIQVLGEMSNKGGPWKKFAQTFFLAEQPNGYYVLNDIFRYLKDDDEVEQEAEDVDEAIQQEIDEADKNGTEVVHQAEVNNIGQPGATPHIPSAKGLEASAGPSTAAIAAAPTNDSVAPVNEVDEKQEPAVTEADDAIADVPPSSQAADSQTERPKVNGTEPTEATIDQIGIDKKVTAASAEEVAPAKPAGVAAAEQEPPAATPAKSDAGAPAPVEAAKPEAPAAAAAPAQPAGPPKPVSWAHLAAADVSRWGSTVSAEVKGVSSSRPAATPAASKPALAAGTKGGPAAGAAPPSAGSSQTHGHVFIKNVVTEHVQEASLRQALESQFGPLKECSVIPSRACAFAEFAHAEAARKAVAASLPTRDGGKGGVAVGKERWMVTVEEKRKPADRPQGGRDGGRGGGPGGIRGGAGGAGRGASNGARGGGASGRGSVMNRRGGGPGN